MPGVRELVDEVRLEVLMDDGTRLVFLVDPLGGDGGPGDGDGPGAVRQAAAPAAGAASPEREPSSCRCAASPSA